ncbi:hypothetical protein [Sphingobacterium tabacisoli]|uniref:Cthe-2314-like HEPN domain-containing protein n=1 Tax=Sphingobacterium tabacisoli TaxID=2044855 RepID=A0ABW5L7P2_9SPHI|nr:hypothetical protein [Sphingobacterium tabacisoli]
MNFIFEYNQVLKQLSEQSKLSNLLQLDNKLSDDGYWDRFARLSVIDKYIEGYGYHLLYEIQSLSNQIHFGVLNCLLFRPLVSLDKTDPNIYNHRLTFMMESTIHCIYGYWNRIALLLNLYLEKPLDKKEVYMMKLLDLIRKQFPELKELEEFKWFVDLMEDFLSFNRNEMVHNYSIIMQEFLPVQGREKIDYDIIIKKLIYHNNAISNDVFRLLDLLEYIESNFIKRNKK